MTSPVCGACTTSAEVHADVFAVLDEQQVARQELLGVVDGRADADLVVGDAGDGDAGVAVGRLHQCYLQPVQRRRARPPRA